LRLYFLKESVAEIALICSCAVVAGTFRCTGLPETPRCITIQRIVWSARRSGGLRAWWLFHIDYALGRTFDCLAGSPGRGKTGCHRLLGSTFGFNGGRNLRRRLDPCRYLVIDHRRRWRLIGGHARVNQAACWHEERVEPEGEQAAYNRVRRQQHTDRTHVHSITGHKAQTTVFARPKMTPRRGRIIPFLITWKPTSDNGFENQLMRAPQKAICRPTIALSRGPTFASSFIVSGCAHGIQAENSFPVHCVISW